LRGGELVTSRKVQVNKREKGSRIGDLILEGFRGMEKTGWNVRNGENAKDVPR